MRTERHQTADQLIQIPAEAPVLASRKPDRPVIWYYPVSSSYPSISRAWQELKTGSSKHLHEQRYMKERSGHDFIPMRAVFDAPAKSGAELKSSATYVHRSTFAPGKPLLRKFDRPTADRLTHASGVRLAGELHLIFSAMRARSHAVIPASH
ncbi:hypothetical protein NOJ05_19700 [Neorhizobium galegae]|uniref:hypothetical protein n=1 Tax=Neorhizobium galegae TaxID=399 RepID=UPI00210257AB|nr:hypothetical protein [Neorhizobium galegae]MCQ1779437.1 hypothetical protein [Neorhizobium galegae]MCQ1795597.1 hypothetical protein [Neorhizobium galegae]